MNRRQEIKKYLTITRIKRSITTRLISICVTVIIGWVITGNPYVGLSIGAIDTFIKVFLYYIHETIWENKMSKDIKEIKKKYNKKNETTPDRD
tara:strand:+ start:211 stop:489 length:279 start_codon:yes stop_codon:yes gene_type:complete